MRSRCIGTLIRVFTSRLSLAGIEGLAGGAMLTVIAETMLPEAYHEGGHYAGVSCLLGFLVTLLVASGDAESSS
jgi:zinc transporter ZupT